MSREYPFEIKKMGVGGILDNTIKIYRSNFLTIMLISLIFYGSYQIVSAILANTFGLGTNLADLLNQSYSFFGDPDFLNDPQFFLDSLIASPVYTDLVRSSIYVVLVTSVLSLFLVPYYNGAVTRTAIGYYRGEKNTVGGWIASMGKNYGRLLLLSICAFLFSVLIVLGFIVAVMILSLVIGLLISSAGVFGTVVGVLLIIGLVFFVVVLAIAFSAAVQMTYAVAAAEDVWYFSAFLRAMKLCFSKLWKTAGNIFVISLIYGMISVVLQIVPTILGYANVWLSSMTSIVISCLVLPLFTISIAMLYIDLRIDREGYDLELRAEAAPDADSEDNGLGSEPTEGGADNGGFPL